MLRTHMHAHIRSLSSTRTAYARVLLLLLNCSFVRTVFKAHFKMINVHTSFRAIARYNFCYCSIYCWKFLKPFIWFLGFLLSIECCVSLFQVNFLSSTHSKSISLSRKFQIVFAKITCIQSLMIRRHKNDNNNFCTANLHNIFQSYCFHKRKKYFFALTIISFSLRVSFSFLKLNSIDDIKRANVFRWLNSCVLAREIFRNEKRCKKIKTKLLLHLTHTIWHVCLMLINGSNVIRISIVFTYFDDGTTDRFRITFCHLYILSVHNVAVIFKHDRVYFVPFRFLFFFLSF